MKKLTFKQIEIIGAVFGIFFGSLLHFLYDWTHIIPIGLFSAVNESPWEHLKLYFFPILIFLVVEWFWVSDKRKLLFAKVAQMVLGMIFIEAFFYTYTGAFGFESIWVDIFSFALAMILGYMMSYVIIKIPAQTHFPAWLLGVFIAILLFFFGFATFYPPQLPIFRDKNTGNYGLVVKSDVNNPVACTMEAKLCPDGSSVGRQGPNCEFSACPVN